MDRQSPWLVTCGVWFASFPEMDGPWRAFISCFSTGRPSRPPFADWQFPSCRGSARRAGFPKSQPSDNPFRYSRLDRESRFRRSNRKRLLLPRAATIWHVGHRIRRRSLSRFFTHYYGLERVYYYVRDGLALWIRLLEVAPVMAAGRCPFAPDVLCTTSSSAGGNERSAGNGVIALVCQVGRPRPAVP